MDVPNPTLIRLVAARYRELQGLLTMADAVFPLYMGVMLMVATWLEDAGFAVVLGVPLFLFMVAQFRWLRPEILAYYRSRFGRVEGRCLLPGPAFMYQGLILGAVLGDAQMPWLTGLIVFTCLGAWPAWIVVRDWPYRWHWLPAVVVASLTAADMSQMPSYHAALQHQGPWALGFGAALACAGFGDHLMLVKTLKRPHAPALATDPASS